MNSVVVKYTSWSWFLLFVLFINTQSATSQSIIKSLPGYHDDTTFHTVERPDEGDREKQIFYYFFEPERDPENDPLVLWLTGGPGCSGLCGLAFEIGLSGNSCPAPVRPNLNHPYGKCHALVL
ncbi:UNVERIFIED_CONTAM: Serine carboxypeptidase-like 1 [Sesamum calycinum]|uniref:Serine carboxypeptidase-like 1 n=1 Tax=Sesamum calycinum TaxID=2727403 RepID=A0AAW2QKR4_9LAMI